MSSLNTFNNGSSMSTLSENFSTMNVSSMPVTSSYSTVLPSTTSTYISSAPSTTTTILPASTTSTYISSAVPLTTTSTYVTATPMVAPLVAPVAPMVGAVPSNMLPAPINDGTRYARLTGQKSRTKRSRRLLVQPLNATGLTTLPAGVPAEGLQAAQAAMASGVAPMLPPPINDGTRYARLTGQKSRTQRSRRLLVQPLNGSGLQTLPAGVPAEQIGAAPVLGRRARRTVARQTAASGLLNNGLAPTMPLAGAMPLTGAMPLSSGLVQPMTALGAPHLTQVPLGAAKLSRNQKRSMRRRNARSAGGVMGQPAMPSSNVLGQPMMAQQPILAAQPLMTKPLIAQPTSLVGTPIF